MSRKFIGTIAAAAIALTTVGANTASAGDRDYKLERTIAAILGVAVVGKIIHDKNKRDRREDRHTQPRQHVQPKQHVQPTWQPHRPRQAQPRHQSHIQPKPRHQSHIQPKPLPRHVNKRLLPRNCFRSFDTYQGTYRGFGQRCLTNNFRHANSLPRHCLTRIRTDRGPRRVFEARCLRNAGYRLARG